MVGPRRFPGAGAAADARKRRHRGRSSTPAGLFAGCRRGRGREAAAAARRKPLSQAISRRRSRRSSQAAHPSFSAADMDRPLKNLGIDSFTTLVIRARDRGCDRRGRSTIGRWMARPRRAISCRAIGTGGTAVPAASAAPPRRSSAAATRLNMPQMALGGLSESWLFKELGDIHWRLITRGLGTPSHEIADANGERLYATFTRFGRTPARGLPPIGRTSGSSLKRKRAATARVSISAK